MIVQRRNQYFGARGEANYMAKLTPALVTVIREATGTLKEIGEHYGIDLSHAGKIRNRKVWRYV